jgi:FkbM family methyltransferase
MRHLPRNLWMRRIREALSKGVVMNDLKTILKNCLPYYVLKQYWNYIEKSKLVFIGMVTKKLPDSPHGKNVIKISFNENKFPYVYLRLGTSDVIVFNAIFYGKEYEFSVKEYPKIIVDAGANIGLSTIYFANKYPDAKIIAIEPEENNYKFLVKNTENYANVVRIKAALWDKIDEIDLVNTGLGNWGFMVSSNNNYNQLKTRIKQNLHLTKTITIGKIISDYSIEKIDILKMDIEGAEKEVFSNAAEWIGNVKAIIVELHERMKNGCNRSFYNNTNGFDQEWQRGEDIFLVKDNYIIE